MSKYKIKYKQYNTNFTHKKYFKNDKIIIYLNYVVKVINMKILANKNVWELSVGEFFQSLEEHLSIISVKTIFKKITLQCFI